MCPSTKIVVALAVCAALVVPVSANAAECPRGSGPALGELACEIARALGDRAEHALVVAVRPAEADEKTRADELGVRLAELAAGAIGPGARGLRTSEPESRAAALPWKTRPLVLLHVSIEAERVRVNADLYTTYPRLWQRAKSEKLGPVAHGFAERGVDGEVRSFLPRVPLVAKTVHRAQGVDPDLVALACGDVDRDGSLEIVTLGRQRIALGRVRAGAFRPFATRSLGELAPIAPAPLREPVAVAWIPEPGVLEIGTSDRAFALRLDGKLERVASLDGRLPWPGGGVLAKLETGGEIDAIAGAALISEKGVQKRVRAERRPDGTVKLADGKRSASIERLGAQLAVGDLDSDGHPELVASLDTLEPDADALVVYSWPDGRKPEERLRIPAPGGVKALALCPARALRMSAIAAKVGDWLWIVE